MSTAEWPTPEPRGWERWRSARQTRKRRRKAERERRDAATLPPLFGSEKSGARFPRGTWQYWAARLLLLAWPLTILAVAGRELKHDVAWVALVSLPLGIELALGERRPREPWWRQGGHVAATAIGVTAGETGAAELLLSHWLIGAVALGGSLAFAVYQRLAKRALDRRLEESHSATMLAEVGPAELPA